MVNIKYVKTPDKLAEEIPLNKLCVDLVVTYKIRRKGSEPLLLKSVTIIYPVTRWFEITQYNNKKAIRIANLVKNTWLVHYPWPGEITCDHRQ